MFYRHEILIDLKIRRWAEKWLILTNNNNFSFRSSKYLFHTNRDVHPMIWELQYKPKCWSTDHGLKRLYHHTPWTVGELIIGNPLEAWWELRSVNITAINIFNKSNPCCVICRYAQLSIAHGAQHWFNDADEFLNLIWYWNLYTKIKRLA